MNAHVLRGGIAAGVLALGAGAIFSRKAARQRRLDRFYANVQASVDRALAHYEGALHTLARCEPHKELILRTLINRPAVDFPNDAELHLEVSANVTPSDPYHLVITVCGEASLVQSITSRLANDHFFRAVVGTTELDGTTADTPVSIGVRDTGPADTVKTLLDRTS